MPKFRRVLPIRKGHQLAECPPRRFRITGDALRLPCRGTPGHPRSMIYRRNPIHPTALYLSARWWDENRRHLALPPPPARDDLAGIERIRVRLPEGVTAPAGWTCRKVTGFGDLHAGPGLGLPSVSGHEVLTISESSPVFEDWIRLHVDIYRRTHPDNPVAEMDTARWTEVFAGPDLHPEGLFAAFRGEAMVGASSLRHDGEGGLELGWTGIVEGVPVRVLARLVAMAARTAARLGASSVAVEVDDTDTALVAAMDGFALRWRNRHFTYEAPVGDDAFTC